jgi:hypothetical protein
MTPLGVLQKGRGWLPASRAQSTLHPRQGEAGAMLHQLQSSLIQAFGRLVAWFDYTIKGPGDVSRSLVSLYFLGLSSIDPNLHCFFERFFKPTITAHGPFF